MRPSQFMEYWSQRPLDLTKFLSMIKDNYLSIIPNKTINYTKYQLTELLNKFSGLRPFIIEWRQRHIDKGYGGLHKIQYLVYLPQNTIEPYISGLEDWYLNRRIPSDMPESEREGIIRLMTDLGWTCLSMYNYVEGKMKTLRLGLELEYETTDYLLEGDWDYIQLEYEGPIIYPYSALNYPGGSIIDPS